MPAKGQKKNIRVVAADDNTQVRNKVVQLLQPEFEVVGTAADGKAALEIIRLLKPEIVVLDISMPIMTGIEVAAEMKKTRSKTRIVFLTVHEDPDFVKAAMKAGGSAYVVKSQMATDLISAMQAASDGNKFISPNCTVTRD